MKPKIIIPGGSGFIGKFVADFFKNKNYEVIILTRGKSQKSNQITYLHWDGSTKGDWAKTFEGAEVILNLAGKSVDCRYNSKNKKAILDSRILSTRIIGQVIEACTQPPKNWLNMSTATIYEDTRDAPANDEMNGKIGDDFSMGIAKAWEAEFDRFSLPSTKKIKLRTSIVLGKEGGALVPLQQLTKIGLGGKNGSGKQFVSWIHIEDLARIIEWLIQKSTADGAYNCTSPSPISNNIFMEKIRNAVGISFGLPATKWMIEIGSFFMQTESELVLKSRKVIPRKLLEGGFKFQFEDLEKALTNLELPK